MKLITLNIWGGHVHSPLLNFIAEHQDTDIFCFQEVYHNADRKLSDDDREVYLNIFAELQAALPHHRAFFRPAVDKIYGISMFVKNTIEVLDEGEINIHKTPTYTGMGPAHSRNMQWVRCPSYTILNVHGLWNGQGKSDAPERLLQSQKIKNFINTLQTPAILCGDFNLRPDTESLKIIEQGMHNLVQSHSITSTRTSFYSKAEKFADYIFTTPDITVHRFEVLPDEVSDHAPLLLEFE